MEVSEGLLYLGGISADSLLERFGSPLYVYEKDVLINRFRKMINCFPSDEVDIHYAMKANYNPSLLNLLRVEGACIDAVSMGDVQMALEVGFQPQQILFTGNNSRFSEIEFSMERGVPVNLGSLDLLQQYGIRYPGTSVSIRVNPGMGAGHHAHCITGGPDSKFGIYQDRLNDALRISETHSLKITGIHSHIGTGIRKTEAMLEAMDLILDAAKRFPDLEFVDFGGGFDIPYRDSDEELDLEELGQCMRQRFEQFCRDYGSVLKMKIEPGRFIIGPAGTLLATVTNLTETPAKRFVGLDTGFNHLVRPIMYGSYHRIVNASRMNDPTQEVAVAGNICESGDVFTRDFENSTRTLGIPQLGDCIAILDTGAYGLSMGSQYNLRELPEEVLVSGGDAIVIRRRQTFKDLIQNFNWFDEKRF
ncbi:MAG: diaminopimelate decarboxylase [SAR324 cluster bacterium]|nr:diaminopimelate decarboxylase [SAR324 cluster bacterium]